jgi:hypothetical protein
MFPGYDKLDGDELLDVYMTKMMDVMEENLKKEKQTSNDLDYVFKRMDRLNYYVLNTFYAKKRQRTPKHLRIALDPKYDNPDKSNSLSGGGSLSLKDALLMKL